MAERDDDNSEKSQEKIYPDSPARIIPTNDYELGSPQWNDIMDEKGDGMFYMMHLEKSTVHQNFFNSKLPIIFFMNLLICL